MHVTSLHRWKHDHAFGNEWRSKGERRTLWVIAITLTMMVWEIIAGTLFGSMALLADGWHMGTHAAALSVTAFAYWYARRHRDDTRFTFGTGKVGALGGFASAVGLGIVACWVLVESVWRFTGPISIRFDDAIAVAAIGLAVNLGCALLLRESHHHHHGHHAHEHDHAHVGQHHDHNLRAAYLHVLADALTSLLAIGALISGKYLGWAFMDPVMGIVGSVVIARWSWGLLKDTSGVLLDAEVPVTRRDAIRQTVEQDADNRVADLHLWRVGPEHMAAIVSVVTHEPRGPEHYKALLAEHADLAHVTVEVNGCAGKPCVPLRSDGQQLRLNSPGTPLAD